MNNLTLLTGADTKASKIYSDDVFSAWTRTGTGADVTVTTNIDMTKGYMLWSKSRSAATDHAVYTSATGVTNDLVTNTTGAVTVQTTGLKSVSSTGHTIGALAKMNTSAATYVDWIFRNSQNFYHHTVVTKTSGSNATFTFSTIATLGMVRVKRTDAAGSWYIWHRSLSAGQLLIGETTAAAATLGHITVSGNTVTLVNGVIADGTYLVEAFGHDTGVDGIIQCGSFTTDGSGTATVNLGWEPQYVLGKRTDTTGNWIVLDTSRGMPTAGSPNVQLYPNLSSTEASSDYYFHPTATGFTVNGASATATWVYLAIARQNKPPTIGTQVYNAIAREGVVGASTITGVGFSPDLGFIRNRAAWSFYILDKLRGSNLVLLPTETSTQVNLAELGSFTNDGYSFIGYSNRTNNSSNFYINHFFKRAPGVLDQICYTGTGANKTEFHNLTVAPELWLIKSRSAATQWVWGSTLLSNTEKINMPTVTGRITDTTSWNSISPTSTTISLGTSTDVNASAATYVAYLWASKVGISKIFSYIGNGTSQVINCGFTTGARYIMIIRTNSGTTQDIFVFDSVRGILSSNDPHLSINTTVAEVTTDDSVDPDLTGFSINQNAATNINVLNATYIGLAYA